MHKFLSNNRDELIASKERTGDMVAALAAQLH